MVQKMKVTTRDTLIIVGVLAALLLGTVMFVYVPQNQEFDRICADIISTGQTLQVQSQSASMVSKMSGQIRTLKVMCKDFNRRLPSQQELGGFLKEISDILAEEEGLSNQLIQPGNPTSDDQFNTLPIVMELSGPYLAVGRFLHRINEMERLARVHNLEVKLDPTEDFVKARIQLNIYFTKR